jgi:serine/threonine-protein kinase
VEHVVMRCLEKSADDRYQSAIALDEALANCSTAGHWTPRHAAAWWLGNGNGKGNGANGGA